MVKREKNIVHHVRVDAITANRLDVDRQIRGYESLTLQYEIITNYYLKHHSLTESERKHYSKKILEYQTRSHVNAMRERLGDEIIQNLTELLVHIFLYKRRNNNKLYAKNDEIEYFQHLNELSKVDKNLFGEMLKISEDFGKVKSRYRQFCKDYGYVDTQVQGNVIEVNNNHILSDIQEKEKDAKFMKNMGLKNNVTR